MVQGMCKNRVLPPQAVSCPACDSDASVRAINQVPLKGHKNNTMKKHRAAKAAQETGVLKPVASNTVVQAEAKGIQNEAASNTQLTLQEKQLLEKHEATIATGLQTFHNVGMAFAEIRDCGLYREHGTFHDYC